MEWGRGLTFVERRWGVTWPCFFVVGSVLAIVATDGALRGLVVLLPISRIEIRLRLWERCWGRHDRKWDNDRLDVFSMMRHVDERDIDHKSEGDTV